VRILNLPELDTPAKRRRDRKILLRSKSSAEKISRNIDTCTNKLQVGTIRIMIEHYKTKYGEIYPEKYIELVEKLNIKLDKLCM